MHTHTHVCMFFLSFVRDHVALRDGAARQRTRRRPVQLAHCQHVLQLLGTHRREIGHCDCCAGLNVFLLLRMLLTIRTLHVLVLRPRASLMGGSFTTYGSLAASKMPGSRLSSDVFLGNTGLGLVLAGHAEESFCLSYDLIVKSRTSRRVSSVAWCGPRQAWMWKPYISIHDLRVEAASVLLN